MLACVSWCLPLSQSNRSARSSCIKSACGIEKFDLQIKCIRRCFAYVGLHNKQLSKLRMEPLLNKVIIQEESFHLELRKFSRKVGKWWKGGNLFPRENLSIFRNAFVMFRLLEGETLEGKKICITQFLKYPKEKSWGYGERVYLPTPFPTLRSQLARTDRNIVSKYLPISFRKNLHFRWEKCSVKSVWGEEVSEGSLPRFLSARAILVFHHRCFFSERVRSGKCCLPLINITPHKSLPSTFASVVRPPLLVLHTLSSTQEQFVNEHVFRRWKLPDKVWGRRREGGKLVKETFSNILGGEKESKVFRTNFAIL